MRAMSDRAPAATSTLCSGAVPSRPSTGCGATTYDPSGNGTKNLPSTPVVARATSAPEPSRTTSTAPVMSRGAQAGSAGSFSTGQVGPADAVPPIPPDDVADGPAACPTQPAATRARVAMRTMAPGSPLSAVMSSDDGEGHRVP